MTDSDLNQSSNRIVQFPPKKGNKRRSYRPSKTRPSQTTECQPEPFLCSFLVCTCVTNNCCNNHYTCMQIVKLLYILATSGLSFLLCLAHFSHPALIDWQILSIALVFLSPMVVYKIDRRQTYHKKHDLFQVLHNTAECLKGESTEDGCDKVHCNAGD